LHSRVAHRALLDLGDAGGYADDDAGMHKGAPPMHLADEVVEHLLRHVEVGDDAVLQWPNRLDVSRRPTHHRLGLVAHRKHRVIGLVDGDDGGFVHHDALAADVDEGVRGAQIYGEVIGEEPGEDAQQHGGALPCGSVSRWTLTTFGSL